MKKQLIIAVSLVAALFACAETNQVVKAKRVDVLFGGFVRKPAQGCIGLVNCQQKLPESELARVANVFVDGLGIAVKVQNSTFAGTYPSLNDAAKLGFNVAVFIVDDATHPGLIVEPDERVALVNVAALEAGLPEGVLGQRLFAVRGRGQIHRAMALACGLGTSNFPNNLYDVTTVKELDNVNPDKLLADTLQRCMVHLEKIGVKPAKRSLYSQACRDGWAPAPTNEYQKAIWDKFHALPTNPLTIKPETKPVKE